MKWQNVSTTHEKMWFYLKKHCWPSYVHQREANSIFVISSTTLDYCLKGFFYAVNSFIILWNHGISCFILFMAGYSKT